ncbi:hypothetical protein [Catellatospora sp. NPDC049133]|uniref:hypothetical protein n=1 Tax=Catellatospora sp. NPDC049133 TaxID=3155499 RepID=UPI0033EA0C52
MTVAVGHLSLRCPLPAGNVCNRWMIPAAESAFAQRSSSPAALGRTLAALGRQEPIVYDEFMHAPLVLRHRDVSAALRDTDTFSTRFYGMGPMSEAMIALDGPAHHGLRRIHNRFFSASASAKYAQAVLPIARRSFGPLAAKAEAELVEESIARYPMEVFLALLGIPDELGDQGLAWVRAIITWLGRRWPSRWPRPAGRRTTGSASTRPRWCGRSRANVATTCSARSSGRSRPTTRTPSKR